MQVNTFGKDLRGDDDIVIILLYLTSFLTIVGIKVLTDGFLHFIAVPCCNLQYTIPFGFCHTLDGVNGVDSLREYNQLLRYVLIFIKEFVLQIILENIEFGILGILRPTVAKLRDKVVVSTEQVNIIRLHVTDGVLHVALVFVASVFVKFGNLGTNIIKTLLVADRTLALLLLCFAVEFCINVNLWTDEDIV